MTAPPTPVAGCVPAWTVREPPLPAAAVVAAPTAVAGLRTATAARLTRGAWLRACASDGWLVVLGDPADLPWAESVTYLGWESGVLLPTTAAVHPGTALIRAEAGARPGELVVLLPGALLIAPMPLRRADPNQLR